MKIILVGCTGFVGGEVLAQCLRKLSVSSILLLSRRKVPEEVSSHPKVMPVLLTDFLNYSDEAKEKMAGASAAIWALRAGSSEVELDYPLAFAATMRSLLVDAAQPFRYVHVSGVLAEKDQEKPLCFLQDGRRVKGLAEIKMREIAHDEALRGAWETYIARPSMITPNPPGIVNKVVGGVLGAMRVDQLASVMLDIIENGGSQETYENADLVSYALRMNRTAAGQHVDANLS